MKDKSFFRFTPRAGIRTYFPHKLSRSLKIRIKTNSTALLKSVKVTKTDKKFTKLAEENGIIIHD